VKREEGKVKREPLLDLPFFKGEKRSRGGLGEFRREK